MVNELLTIVCFLVIPLSFTAVVIVLTTISRFRFLKQLKLGMKQGRFSALEKPQTANKIRLLAAMSLVSVIGSFIILALVILDLVPFQSSSVLGLLIVFLALANLGSVAGMIIFKTVTPQLKDR